MTQTLSGAERNTQAVWHGVHFLVRILGSINHMSNQASNLDILKNTQGEKLITQGKNLRF